VGLGATLRTTEEIAEDNKQRRLALRKLAASPELIAVSVVFLILFGLASDFNPVALIFGTAIYGIFGWIFLSNGDAIVASLLLLGLGLTCFGFMTARLSIDESSLAWIAPALLIVCAETAISYNNFRRRQSTISVQIGRTSAINIISVVALSVVLASAIRWLTQVDGRVEWPWYATTVVGLALGWFTGLIVIRRTAGPAERRRYNPGRRMLPPPR
jgi:hypothetical protein